MPVGQKGISRRVDCKGNDLCTRRRRPGRLRSLSWRMRKILLFRNPSLQDRGRYRADLASATSAFAQAGVAVEAIETGENRAAGAKAAKALGLGYDAFVVCGGDGTIFDVLQGIAGSEIPLGIIPLGTGNILAQNLKIPKEPAAAARWILAATPQAVPLGKITCCGPEGKRSWFFAMSAGMGMHAALMTAARDGKQAAGRAAYFAAGIKLVFTYPVRPFDIEITTTGGEVIHRRVCEALAVRVAALNRWRPGGGLAFPFLRLATVQGHSVARLTRAAAEGFLGSAGARDRQQRAGAAALYEDVLRVACHPTPEIEYRPPLAVQADGEVLGNSCAVMEMAEVSLRLLSHPSSGSR
jgi:diacylglycerol kinase (ATP)